MANSIIEKRCTKCNIAKVLSDFHHKAAGWDGLNSRCKECVRASVRRYIHSDQGKRTRQKYNATPKEREAHRLRGERYYREHRATVLEAGRKYVATNAGRIAMRKADKKRRWLYPERQRARRAVRTAIQNQHMPCPSQLICLHCGETAEQYHHHHGYGKAQTLDVVPVCRACHYACG